MPDEDLFAPIANFGNLFRAARIAARGKRYRRAAAGFLQRRAHWLLKLSGRSERSHLGVG